MDQKTPARKRISIHIYLLIKMTTKYKVMECNKTRLSEMTGATRSPCPAPQFYLEAQTFSTKKARATPREQAPPRPPVKSVPPVSRVFPYKQPIQRAQAVSFKGSDSSFLNKYYNERSKELYFDQCFEVICKLGTGSFGEVFKVRSKEDGKYYAIKRSRERFRGESDRQRKLEEVQKHEQLPKHRNCIYFVKAWEERQHLYIQTELCETSLSNYAEQNHDIPESMVWNYLVDLLLAVRHLHNHELVHLDIKPANIFITKDGICKLGDFGLVLDLKKGDLSDAQEGDPKYLAPELMQGKFTKAADIFSLGITILEMACDLDLPRQDSGWHQLRQGRIPREFLSALTVELAQIICLMMHPDFTKRPSADEILSFSLVKKIHRRRLLILMCKDMTSSVLSFLRVFIVLLGYLAHLILHPFKNLFIKKDPVSLPIRPKHPSEWDHSYSDDEVFEDSINLSRNSLATALSDTSTSSESRNGSFSISNFTEKLVNSTPASTKVYQRVKTATPTVADFSRRSPSYFINPSPNCTSVMNSSFHQSIHEEEESARTCIGPKNLMNMFEAESSDDSS